MFPRTPSLLTLLLAVAVHAAPATNSNTHNVRALTPPVLPAAVASFGAEVEGHWIYLYGGHTGRAHVHTTENVFDGFGRLSLIDGRWESLPAGRAMQSVALVAHEGAIYRVGGLEPRNAPGAPEALYSSTDFFRFDPEVGTWTELTPLPEPRSSHDAVVVGDKLFVLGGWTLAGEGKDGTWLETAWVCDLTEEDPAWRSIPAPAPRRAVDASVWNGKVYLLGGMDTSNEVVKRAEVLDLETGVWREVAELPGWSFGIGGVGTATGLYACGLDGDVLRLADDEASWDTVARMALPRFFHRLLAHGDELVAVGGANRTSHLRLIERIAPGAPTDELKMHVWKTPYPGSARNRQGILLHKERLIVAGGNNSTGQHDFEPENFLDEAYEIRLGDLSVRKIEPLPVKRQTFSTIMNAEDKVGYLVGGFGDDGEVARSHGDLFAFDLRTGAWKQLPGEIPGTRTQCHTVHHEGLVWLFGGLDYDPTRGRKESFQHRVEVLSWNPERDAGFEDSGVRLPQPRRAFGGALLGSKFYLVSGMREGFQLVEACDVFDLDLHEWSTIPSPSVPRISPHLVAVGGKLVLLGGTAPKGGDEEGFAPCSIVEVFDPEVGAWSELTHELPFPVRHMQVREFHGNLLFYSLHSDEPGVLRWAILELP